MTRLREILLPWDSQPQEPASADWSSPLARNLELLAIPSNGLVDATGRNALTPNSVAIGGGPGGSAWRFTSGGSVLVPASPRFDALNGWTAFGVVRSTSASGNQFVINKNFNGTNSVGFSLGIHPSAQTGGAAFFNGGWRASEVVLDIRGDNRVHVVVGRHLPGVNLSYWVDGVVRSLQPHFDAPLSGNMPVYIGRYENDGASFVGDIYLAGFASRAWSDNEIKQFSDEPYSAFEKRRIFVPMASAGGGFTLALDAGSYTYTGQNTGLAVSRKLAFNAGSYAYTGQTTTLSYGRKLSLDAGSYTYTGQSVNATVARKLSFNSGSYSITGNDVTLTYDSSTDTYTLALDSGSYTYTGQTTDFKVSRKLSFDAGVYAYTGQTTNFAVGRKLSLNAGSYAYTGQATTFVVNRNLALDSGAYTYTGQAAGLAYSGSTGFVTIKAGSWLRYRVI